MSCISTHYIIIFSLFWAEGVLIVQFIYYDRIPMCNWMNINQNSIQKSAAALFWEMWCIKKLFQTLSRLVSHKWIKSIDIETSSRWLNIFLGVFILFWRVCGINVCKSIFFIDGGDSRENYVSSQSDRWCIMMLMRE